MGHVGTFWSQVAPPPQGQMTTPLWGPCGHLVRVEDVVYLYQGA